MKTSTLYLRQRFLFLLILISIVWIPNTTLAIEPIATIGLPIPKKHAFISNDKYLRVVPTHIQIVDSSSGVVVDEFADLTQAKLLGISPSGSHVAILNYTDVQGKRMINIWDVGSQSLISEWEIETRPPSTAAFSPVQPLLVISADDKQHLWNWQTGEFIATATGERRQSQFCYSRERGSTCGGARLKDEIVFTPDGKYFIVSVRRFDIELWNVETRELEGYFDGQNGHWVEGLAISPDGKHLASYERSNWVYVWDIETQQLLWKVVSGIEFITDLTFSPDSQHLYVASRTGGLRKFGNNPYEGWDDKVRVWDVESGQQIDTFSTEFRDLETITLSPHGKTVLLNYHDAEVMWDIQKKRKQNVWADFIKSGWYHAVVVSPDGKTVVSVSSHFFKTWDVASEQMKVMVSADGYRYRSVTISPDSQTLVVGRSSDRFLEFRDIHTGKLEMLYPHSLWYVESITFGSTGKWFAVSDSGRQLAILDTKNTENPQPLHSHVDLGADPRFYQFGFSENDKYFAAYAYTSSNDDYKRWILLWEREATTFVFKYAWEASGFYYPPEFATQADGSTLLAAAAGDVEIWKLSPSEPQLLSTLKGYGDAPVRFTADNKYLFTAKDETSQLWDWRTETPIEHPSIPDYFAISQDGAALLAYSDSGDIQVWNGKTLLPKLPVEPHGKQIVTLGEVKRDQLLQNFPNPSNPETWFPFHLANNSNVKICIYTPTGKLIRTLSLGIMSAGDYSSQSKAIHWDGRNSQGERVSSGIYLYTIKAGDFSATRKMLIRK